MRDSIELMPGADTLIRTLKRPDHRIGIVSGEFTQITDGLAASLGLDYAVANTPEIAGGRLTERLVGPITDRTAKAEALQRLAADAIGDGANDLDMIAAAGLGVAFSAKPAVRERTPP